MPHKTGKEQAQRGAGGRFAPGRSGNPSGRPRGARNRVSRASFDLLASASGEIVEKLIELAKKGDPVALRLCVERIIPRRSTVVDVEIPRMERAEDIAHAAARVIQLAASGDMSLEEARQFLQLLDTQRQALETSDLEVRIEAMEQLGISSDPYRDRKRGLLP